MLSGMNASWSFFGGFVLAWGIIAPSLIHTGVAVGIQRDPDNFPEVFSYQAMKFKTQDEFIHAPSPRYWLLWPGVLVMLVYSFAELAMSSRGMFSNLGGLGSSIVSSVRRWKTRGDPNVIHAEEEDNDPSRVSICTTCEHMAPKLTRLFAQPEDRVPTWAWMTGVICSLIISCALLATQFSLNVGEVILALSESWRFDM